jgi:hypothetical protein
MKRPLRPVPALLKKYWFMVGLVAVAAVTMADRYEWTVAAGRWLKAHQGPGMVIFAIFFFPASRWTSVC